MVHYSNISVIKHVTRLKEKKTKPIIPISAEQEFDKNSTSIRDKNFQKNSPCFSFSLSASCPVLGLPLVVLQAWGTPSLGNYENELSFQWQLSPDLLASTHLNKNKIPGTF